MGIFLWDVGKEKIMGTEYMLHRLREIIKTPHPEVMILPFGNGKPEEVIEWIVNLSDEEFCELMQTPIIVQAKIFYTKIRKQMRGE